MTDKIIHALISVNGVPIGHMIVTNHGPTEEDPENDSCEFQLEHDILKKDEFASALDEIYSAIGAALHPEEQ
jgi:hypothetical protein